MLPYEEGSRIPLIVVDPRSPSAGKGLRSKALVGNIDFAPTMLGYAGLDPPAKMDGRDLRTLVDQPEGSVREALLLIQAWGWADTDHNRALSVVTDTWKYIRWCFADEHVPPAEELYNFVDDPFEMSERSAADPQSLGRMHGLYDEFLKRWSDECVDIERYTRYRVIFDRHTDWRKKSFDVEGRGNGFDEIMKVYRKSD